MNDQELESLFISDPSKAVEKSREIICSVSSFKTYEEFKKYHIDHRVITNCEENLFGPQLTVLCFDCSVNHSFAVCLSCFLKGNHEGHYYIILPRFFGHCACGDSSCWKQSGFCSNHSIPPEDHPENYLDAKLRTTLTDIIFKASITALTKLTTGNDEKVKIIILFLISFFQFGAGFYRLLSITLTEKIDIKKLLKNVSGYSQIFNHLLNELCLYCFHDKLFKKNIEMAIYENITEKFFDDSLDVIVQKKKNDHYQIWESFWSQVFTSSNFKYNIEHKNWNWVNLFVHLSSSFKEFLGFVGNKKFQIQPPFYFKSLVSDASLLTKIEPIEKTQELFDTLFTKVFNNGTKNAPKNVNNINVVASFKPNRAENYYMPIYIFQYCYLKFYRCFKNKPDLRFDLLFNELDKGISITSIYRIGLNSLDNGENENEKFIQKFVGKENRNSPNLCYYKSLHNGGSFFVSLPLYDALVALFRLDNLSRIKIARFLSSQKYQNLRVKLGIITLKKILSFVCFHQGFVPKSNFGLVFLYDQYDSSLRTTYTISRYFPLFQMLIGLECKDEIVNNDYEFSLSEYFAFELAREIGLFDNFSSDDYKDEKIDELKEEMMFSFLFISLLIVIERTLFNLNSFKYVHEQMVFALKNGVSVIDKLHGCYDIEAFNVSETFPVADKMLSHISTTNKDDEDVVDQEIYYYLKDGIQCQTLSAINPINQQKTLLTKEISKNPTKLLKLNDFQSEEDYFFHPTKSFYEENLGLSDGIDESEYDSNIDTNGLNIRLKKFLLTPSVLAVVYYALRTNVSAINDHLAMNILVLASKFVADKEGSSSIKEKEVHFQSLNDLISKIERAVFNYRVDEKGDAFVTNTLNKSTFIDLLKMRFSNDSMPPKSFIDVLLSKGELGRNVIDQMAVRGEIDIEIDDQKDEHDEKVRKKKLAMKRKQEILAQFNQVQSNFVNQKDSISNDPTSSVDTNSDCCSVCGSSDIGNLSYPVYFYRTKIPFIVDKPPFSDCSEPNEILQAVDDFDDETNLEEEEEASDDYDYSVPVDQVLNQLLSQIPGIVDLNQEFVENVKHQVLSKYARHEIRQHRKEMRKRHQILKEKDQRRYKRCTVGSNFVIQFGICPHPLHPHCVTEKEFKCPLCKSYKNGFLPCISSIPLTNFFRGGYKVDGSMVDFTSLTEDFVHSISIFFDKFASLINKPKITANCIFVELVKSIAGLIVTYEIRFRNLRKSLNSKKNFDLARNLFLTAWFAYRMHGRPIIIADEEKLTVVQRFVKKLIENDRIIDTEKSFENDLNEIVPLLIQSIEKNSEYEGDVTRKEKEIILFLRRVFISEFFLLDEFDGDKIEWQENLSVKNLCQKFHVSLKTIKEDDDFHLNQLVFEKMPLNYFDFSQKPFYFPIEKISKAMMFIFLDYKNLIDHFDNFSSENSESYENCEERMKSSLLSVEKNRLPYFLCFDYGARICPSVLFYVGGDATKVIVVDQGLVSTLKPFYFNFYNRPDIGFSRLQPLKLNEKSYKRFIDEILSGDFSYYLEKIFK